MYGVEVHARVRLSVFCDGLSHRELARRFGIDLGTVSKIAEYAEPPGYKRVILVHRSKLADHEPTPHRKRRVPRSSATRRR